MRKGHVRSSRYATSANSEQIEILPPDRKNVSYEILAQLLDEYILLTAPDVDVSAALSMMPLTTTDYQ
jgi:hypothetical protein